jgi:hypothetical protein
MAPGSKAARNAGASKAATRNEGGSKAAATIAATVAGSTHPIGYYSAARGKNRLLQYEVRHSMVMPAQDSGIKPAVRHFDVFRNTVRK